MLLPPSKDAIEVQVRRAVEDALESGKFTRYSLSQASGVGYRVLSRYLDEGRDIKLSTASSLAVTLGYELRKRPRKK